MRRAPAILCAALSLFFCPPQGAPPTAAQEARAVKAERPRAVGASRVATAPSILTGVYRLDPEAGDKLYSVVSGASSNLPFGEQQRFFIDLTIRLTPPDQLAIARRGRFIDIASSRAPRTSFEADGREHSEAAPGGATTRVRATILGDQLLISSRGDDGEGYGVTFAPIDGGRRLRVTRRISARELSQPVVIRSVYDKISEVARWDIYGEPRRDAAPARAEVASASVVPAAPTPPRAEAAVGGERRAVDDLRAALEEWVGATNARDIRRQMSFYMPKLKAFYLTRDTPASAVRAEKARVFERAQAVSVAAEEPEVLFLEGGRVAVMRFRKRYAIEGGPASRRGEVVQELRWRKTADGWKIFSERDVRVIR